MSSNSEDYPKDAALNGQNTSVASVHYSNYHIRVVALALKIAVVLGFGLVILCLL